MDAQVRPKKRGREGEKREKVTENGTPLRIPNPSFSQLQSTSDVWPSITRMGPVGEFPRGDTFVLTLSSGSPNTSLFVCVAVSVYMCVCLR